MLINSVDVSIDDKENLEFIINDKHNPVQMKMCDLGLSEIYQNDTNGNAYLLPPNAGNLIINVQKWSEVIKHSMQQQMMYGVLVYPYS